MTVSPSGYSANSKNNITAPTIIEIFTVADIAGFPQSGQLPQAETSGGNGCSLFLQWGHGDFPPKPIYIGTR